MSWSMTPRRRYRRATYTTPAPERRRFLAAELRKLRSSVALDRAEEARALAETERAEAFAWQIRIGNFRTVGVGFAVLFGMSTLFCYCFFSANFIPSGVSAGDTLLFAFLALALGVSGLMLALAGAAAWLPLMPSAGRPAPGTTDASKAGRRCALVYGVTCLLLTSLMFLAIRDADVRHGTRLLSFIHEHLLASSLLAWLAFALPAGATLWKRGVGVATTVGWSFICGLGWLSLLQLLQFRHGPVIVWGAALGGEFLALALFSAARHGIQPKARLFGETFAFVAAAALLPVLVLAIASHGDREGGIAALVFGGFGLYADDAVMEVSTANLRTLVAAAELQGGSLDVCGESDGGAIVTGLKVWWHGIGARSRVELPRDGAPGIMVDLDATQAHLIGNSHARCLDLKQRERDQVGRPTGARPHPAPTQTASPMGASLSRAD